MNDQRDRIIEQWRRRHAALMKDHARALKEEQGDPFAARRIESEIRQLAKAIRSYKEEKLGELTHQTPRRHQREA